MSPKESITNALIEEVCQRLADNKRVRRTLPEGGRIHIDRQLPFLCIYRQPAEDEDRGTEALVISEASYVVAPSGSRYHKRLADLIQAVTAKLHELFGSVLILEIWAKPDPGRETDPRAVDVLPTFEVTAPGSNRLDSTVEILVRHLNRIKVLKQNVDVEVERGGQTRPPGMKALLPKSETRGVKYSKIGIAVPPVYRDESGDETQHFPLLLRSFRCLLSYCTLYAR